MSMNGKRVWILALAGVLSISLLAGCTKKGDENQGNTEPPAQSDVTDPGAAPDPGTAQPETPDAETPDTETPDAETPDAGTDTPDSADDAQNGSDSQTPADDAGADGAEGGETAPTVNTDDGAVPEAGQAPTAE